MKTQCLNPIIAFDKNQFRQRPSSNKFDFLRKRELIGFHNFKKACEIFGKDYVLESLKSPGTFLLPCRKCSACQLNRSREWAIRNTLEAKQYDSNECIFITLTYNDESLDYYGFVNDKGNELRVPVLRINHVQNFLKRLRKKYNKYNIRFFMCGEYGSKTLRPHYHILLYGLPLSAIEDLNYLYTHNKNDYYNSTIIEDLWSCGFVVITTFSEYTAMYTSRYCTKKQSAKTSLNYCLPKEVYNTISSMSRRPGIAYQYYIDHKDDIYKNDEFFYHFDDKTLTLKPLGFFDRLYDVENPVHMHFIKENRKEFYKCWEYFEKIESDLSLSEYLTNLDDLNNKKFKQRSEV